MRKLLKKLFGRKPPTVTQAQREAFWYSVSTNEPTNDALRRFEEAGKKRA